MILTNIMQDLLLSLAKASKQKGLAYIKLMHACDSKKIFTAYSVPAKIYCVQRLQILKTANAYRFKDILI